MPNLAWRFSVGLVFGFTSIALMTPSTAIVQVNAAPEMLACILALQAIVFLGSTPIGGPLLRWFVKMLGP